MIVGVQVLIFALLVAHKLQAAVGDHLVGVHVGGSAGTSLEHVHHEVSVQLAAQQFVAGVADGLGLLGRQDT